MQAKKLFILFCLFIGNAYADSKPSAPPNVKNPFYDLPQLETKRLIVRKVDPSDLDDFCEIFLDNNVTQFLGFDIGSTKEDVKKVIDGCLVRYKNGQPALWALEYRKNNKVIGWCGFFDWKSEKGIAEVGTALSRRYWGLGIMTEATDVIYAFAFNEMGLNSIHAHCDPENKASLHIFEKDGFKIVGKIPEYAYVRGAYRDRLLLCLLKNDFFVLKS
jgi:ribosomal-protein-alanine N-acetyltransferase